MVRSSVLVLMLSLGVTAGAAAGPAGPSFQGDPQAIAEVQAAFQRFAAAPTYRARMTTAGVTQTMEHVAPDRFHVLIPGDQPAEMFIIGRDSWMRTGGTCQKLSTAVPSANPREVMEYSADTKITVTRGGPQTVDGTPVQTYIMAVEFQGNQIQERLFVATGTGLPRRVEIRSGQATTVVDYVDYGTPITINNPPC